MQETFSIGITGKKCVKKKNEIIAASMARGMSVSKFMLWLFEQYQTKQSRPSA